MDKTDPFQGLPRRSLYERKPVTKNVTPVSIVSSVSTANTAVSSGAVSMDEARKAYMRELMRKRRAAAKAKDHG